MLLAAGASSSACVLFLINLTLFLMNKFVKNNNTCSWGASSSASALAAARPTCRGEERGKKYWMRAQMTCPHTRNSNTHSKT